MHRILAVTCFIAFGVAGDDAQEPRGDLGRDRSVRDPARSRGRVEAHLRHDAAREAIDG